MSDQTTASGVAAPAAAPSALRAARVPTGWLLAVIVLLFGISWPVVKATIVGGAASPLWLAASRSILATAGTAALVGCMGRLRLPRRADLPVIAAVGLLQLFGYFALAHLGVGLVGAGRTALLANAAVVWTTPLSVLLLREKASASRWFAAAAGLLGILVLVAPAVLAGGAVLGYVFLLGAALAWSLAILATRRWPPVTPTLELLPFSFALSVLPIVAMAMALEPGGGIMEPAWPAAAFNGLIVAPIGTWALLELSRRLPAIRASVILLAVPVAGILLSTFWLHEPVGLDLLLGASLICAAVALAARG